MLSLLKQLILIGGFWVSKLPIADHCPCGRAVTNRLLFATPALYGLL
jgi:hypothetical protein